jgi:hypothetical protein
MVPLALAGSLLFNSTWLQALLALGWGGNFLMSLVFSVILVTVGDVALTTIGGEAVMWRRVMTLWTLQFFATSFTCHPNTAWLQATCKRVLNPFHAGSGSQQHAGRANGCIGEQFATSSQGQSAQVRHNVDPVSADSESKLKTNWMWQLSSFLYVWPALAVLLSFPVQSWRLLQRLFGQAPSNEPSVAQLEDGAMYTLFL